MPLFIRTSSQYWTFSFGDSQQALFQHDETVIYTWEKRLSLRILSLSYIARRAEWSLSTDLWLLHLELQGRLLGLQHSQVGWSGGMSGRVLCDTDVLTLILREYLHNDQSDLLGAKFDEKIVFKYSMLQDERKHYGRPELLSTQNPKLCINWSSDEAQRLSSH